MRHSGSSVHMMHLTELVTGISDGELGIPEFQRDFDWSETDIRSLLATIFAGWPAGSLLFLDARAAMFKLRPFENGPPIKADPTYVVLDGQQRLTSVFQALTNVGDSVFAVEWSLDRGTDLEEGIVSFRKDVWEEHYSTQVQQFDRKIIPVSALLSATKFFTWRDDLLSMLPAYEAAQAKEAITRTYSQRLSNIHDYEFPVVLLDRKTDAHAISRIFERVNRTGLKLGAFDLMVAKTFSANWNLRDKWVEARERHPMLASFFEEDGMPLLQSIALLQVGDLRQSAVLNLETKAVRERWDRVAAAADEAIGFLRVRCGVVRRDFMPYPNMLPPLIALAHEGRLTSNSSDVERWFWDASFSGAYDAAANTRLVAHYKDLLAGNLKGNDERKIVSLNTVTRKSDRALWTAFNCLLVSMVERSKGAPLAPELVSELDVSSLYSVNQVVASNADPAQVRSALNSILVPRRFNFMTRKVGSDEALKLFTQSEFAAFIGPQLPVPPEDLPQTWAEFRRDRAVWLQSQLARLSVTSVEVEH